MGVMHSIKKQIAIKIGHTGPIYAYSMELLKFSMINLDQV